MQQHFITESDLEKKDEHLDLFYQIHRYNDMFHTPTEYQLRLQKIKGKYRIVILNVDREVILLEPINKYYTKIKEALDETDNLLRPLKCFVKREWL